MAEGWIAVIVVAVFVVGVFVLNAIEFRRLD